MSFRAKDHGPNHAYMLNANIVLFYNRNPKKKNVPGDGKSNPAVLIHETGHALDRWAYGNSTLSKTNEYREEYAKDSKVVDDYAATNFLEDVAQNTVMTTYDLVVPGGFRAVTKDWRSVQHQLNIMKRKQKEAGNLLVPGGRCGQRLKSKSPVPIPLPNGKNITRRALPVPSTLQLDGELGPRYLPSGPSRRAYMAEIIPNMDLPEGLEVITPRSDVDTSELCEVQEL